MANQNDEKILDLKKQIEEKKKLILKSAKFNPITNCSINFYGVQLNLHALSKEALVILYGQLKSVEEGVKKSLVIKEEPVISGFKISDWIDDVESKYATLDIKQEEARLKNLEKELDSKLSGDLQVSMYLDNVII